MGRYGAPKKPMQGQGRQRRAKEGNAGPRKAKAKQGQGKAMQGQIKPMQSKARGCFEGGALKGCMG